MKKLTFSLLLIASIITLFSFKKEATYQIYTDDIDHFWEAYDSLAFAKTTNDSVAIIDRLYFGRATVGLKAYRVARPNTPLMHIESIRQYPKYWRSVRPMTMLAKTSKSVVAGIFQKYQSFIPNFRKTNVCFAIGCINSGGTTDANWVFIGTEIASADSTVDKSEMSGMFKDLIGTGSGDMTNMIAHEAIHTQQISMILQEENPKEDSFYGTLINEGVADFIPYLLFKTKINEGAYAYGRKNECALWQQLQADLAKNDTKLWFYNGMSIKDRPADVGYFMGFRIAEAYYNKQKNKREALDILLKSRDYAAIVAQSGYNGGCSK